MICFAVERACATPEPATCACAFIVFVVYVQLSVCVYVCMVEPRVFVWLNSCPKRRHLRRRVQRIVSVNSQTHIPGYMLGYKTCCVFIKMRRPNISWLLVCTQQNIKTTPQQNMKATHNKTLKQHHNKT
eukprot:GHVQ01021030.1.p2 GENE.GHVQ01021030.1~~GHVQ01021030.1.p2  ORF type:complete len:129 (+),score=18.75 GHVQ01021030.1:307-693(+)